MWGTYWEWDPRIIFELILLWAKGAGQYRRARRCCAVSSARIASARCFAIVGVVNVPIIHYSVEWWNSLHQTASVMKLDSKPTMPLSMLFPLLSMFLGDVSPLRRLAIHASAGGTVEPRTTQPAGSATSCTLNVAQR